MRILFYQEVLSDHPLETLYTWTVWICKPQNKVIWKQYKKENRDSKYVSAMNSGVFKCKYQVISGVIRINTKTQSSLTTQSVCWCLSPPVYTFWRKEQPKASIFDTEVEFWMVRIQAPTDRISSGIYYYISKWGIFSCCSWPSSASIQSVQDLFPVSWTGQRFVRRSGAKMGQLSWGFVVDPHRPTLTTCFHYTEETSQI